MNELMIFENTEVEITLNEQGEPLFEIYSTGMALGYSRTDGKTYITIENTESDHDGQKVLKCFPRKDRIHKTIKNAEISTVVRGVQQYFTEEQLYDFMLEAHTNKCKKFRKWVTHEVLPQIRKQGYYISKSITDEQVEKLESEVQDLKNKLHHERTQRLYNSNEIVKLINVDGLISSSLYKYLDSDLHLGEYKICKVNRRFTPNRDFTSRIVNEGYAKVSGKSIIFTEEFANRINSCPNALFRLKEINDLELQVRDRAIENRKPF